MKQKTTIPLKRVDFFINNIYGGSHLLAKIKINGRNALFVVDTGASSSVLDINAFQKFQNKEDHRLLHEDGAGAGGAVTVHRTKLNSINLNGVVFRNFPMGLIDLSHIIGSYRFADTDNPPDGVLGADLLIFLRGVVDVGNLKMTLHGLSKSRTKQFYADQKINNKKVEEQFPVQTAQPKSDATASSAQMPNDAISS